MIRHADAQSLIDDADAACRSGDLATLASAVRALVPWAPQPLQYDVVAVAELAALDEPLACDRWRSIVRRLVAAFGPGGVPQGALSAV
jgi:hypothetical protein